jgi:hypothetical protein
MTRFRAPLALIASAALLLPSSPALGATAKAGATCSKAGATAKVGGKTLVCTKSGKRLVWLVKPSAVAAPTPTPSPSPTPTATVNAVWGRTGWSKPTSAAAVTTAATNAFATWAATTRSTITPTFKFQDGTPADLATWIRDGVSFMSARLPDFGMPRAYTAIAAKDSTYHDSVMTEIYGAQVAQQERGAFGNAPAAASGFTNVWNLSAIARDDLMNRDRIGMQQTPGHEYFHLLQNNITKCGPCFNTPKEVPQWFWEGPAMFMGIQTLAYLKWNQYAEGRRIMIERNGNSAATRGLPLKEVTVNDGRIDPYAIGFVASEFLVANIGMTKFIDVYYEVGKGKTFAQAFEAQAGIPLTDFYEMFEDARATLGVARTS